MSTTASSIYKNVTAPNICMNITASNICINIAASSICMKITASDIYIISMNIYRAANICMNIYGAFHICVLCYGASNICIFETLPHIICIYILVSLYISLSFLLVRPDPPANGTCFQVVSLIIKGNEQTRLSVHIHNCLKVC